MLSLQEGSDRAVVVIRIHDDFVWLLHCLKTQDNVTGVIVSVKCSWKCGFLANNV